jgi:GNAT superfamily N-acetyltransferase
VTDLQALTDAHNARMRAIDPLIPPAGVPEPEIDEDRLLTVPGAAAYTHCNQVDPETLLACWGALERHSLIDVRVAGEDPARSLRALLSAWGRELRVGNQDGTDETGATFTWPSRDAAMVRPLLEHGLVPHVVVAARTAGRASAPRERADVEIRRLEPDRVDDAARLALAIVEWDAQFGSVTVRPSTLGCLHEELAEAAADPNESAWLAYADGDPVGLVSVDIPAKPWMAAIVNAQRPAYLGFLSVVPGRRSAGVGSALVEHVHRRVDAAGCDVTLLHHAVLNPLSGPFWNQWGYRPLWTGYDVRPHTAVVAR